MEDSPSPISRGLPSHFGHVVLIDAQSGRHQLTLRLTILQPHRTWTRRDGRSVSSPSSSCAAFGSHPCRSDYEHPRRACSRMTTMYIRTRPRSPSSNACYKQNVWLSPRQIYQWSVDKSHLRIKLNLPVDALLEMCCTIMQADAVARLVTPWTPPPSTNQRSCSCLSLSRSQSV